jgi:hypothetical protein
MATTFEIHPSVGIARVGTSTAPDGFFFAPEPGAPTPLSFRDAAHELKRQAARFRIFRCERDAQNKITAFTEITSATATIEWNVEVANRKACGERILGVGRRNNAASANDPPLVIAPGARTITGPNQTASFDNGRFRTTVVPLGEIRTDADARLLFIPSDGRAGSNPANRPLTTFADNDNWFDAMCDGPVRARVTIGGTAHDAKPAWVVTAPPDYAPEIHSIVSWHDVAYQAAVNAGFLPTPPARPSFQNDILPLLRRFSRLQWTTRLFIQDFGPSKKFAFEGMSPASLADPAQNTVLRAEFFAALRPPLTSPSLGVRHLPRLNDDSESRDVMMLTPVQYQYLRAWKEGTFLSDAGAPPPQEMLPDAFDRVSLQAAVGGAFFPGIEAGSIIATAVYAEALRINAATLAAGTLTQRNAVPWQADFFACKRDAALGWWPAQRPDDLFLDTATALTRTGAQPWAARVIGVEGPSGLIQNFGKLGIARERSASGQTVIIETERQLPR